MFVLAVPGLAQAQTAAQKPLDKDQIMSLVTAGMDNDDLAKRIQDRGIDFDLTDDYLQALRKAGAQDVVIKALRAAKPTPLSKEQVLKLVAAGVSGQRAVTLVKQRGIDFQPDEKYLEPLRIAGGDEALVAAVRAAGEAVEARRPKVQTNPKDGLKYVLIPPGTFMMGCSKGDSECSGDEEPAHRVTISKSFWMGQTEVTVAAYKHFAQESGKDMPTGVAGNDAMPIVNVSWDDATAYCSWAGGRLLSEAEWEYAARAGSTEARYGPVDEVAWYDKNSGGGTHAVAQKRPNAFNLFDMLGNVWEWTSDWYGEKYYEGSAERDPQGPGSGEYRVLRGGSWDVVPRDTRVSDRYGGRPGNRDIGVGVRCAREVGVP
jgi:formylglycine-generating enzyme required for sulfatase activity